MRLRQLDVYKRQRFTRLRASTLGDGYDLQDVLAAIEGKEKRPGHSERKIDVYKRQT